MLSTIVEGEAGWSEFFLLVAIILCVVVAALRRASIDAVLMAFAVGFIAAAVLVL